MLRGGVATILDSRSGILASRSGGPARQDPILDIDLLDFSQFADSVIEVSEFLFVILF